MVLVRHVWLAALLACAVLAGCATSRSEVRLKSPPAVAPSSAAKVVVIRSVTDERVFEEAPSEPSTPSLGFGGASKNGDAVKARAIGRKRNSWGKALGDVLLENGQTVTGVIRENLAAALQQAGYQVKNAADADASAIVVDVHVKKFWAWFQPGFWAITLNSDVATDLSIGGAAMPTTVSVHVEDAHAAATENSWIEIVDKALEAYRREVAAKTQGKL